MQVDPYAENFASMSPYNSMGGNPISNVDPEGDLFYAMPQVGFSSYRGLSLGLEVGIGMPGVASISLSGGYSFGSNNWNWSAQGGLAGFYAGYGSTGGFGGYGLNFGGLTAGVNYSQNGGWSAGAGLGGGFGNGYSASLGVSYGQSGFSFGGSASSLYAWGTVSPGISADGDGVQGDGNRVRGNTGLYSDETEAYNVMWDQSVSEQVETAGWITDDGILMSPIEFPGKENKNTFNSSSNTFYKVTLRGKTLYAHHNGNKYRILGQMHTHPLSNRGHSGEDRNLAKFLGYGSVYAMAQTTTYRGYYVGNRFYSTRFGLTIDLLSGKHKLIGQ